MKARKTLSVPICPSSSLRLEEQIAAYFRKAILSNQIKEGELLPIAGSIANASQPTVLKAYRALQAEGLVKVRRTQGTVVTQNKARHCHAILVRHESQSFQSNPFFQTVLIALIRDATLAGNPPRVFVIPAQKPGGGVDLPPAFLEALSDGEIRGVFVQPNRHDHRIVNWLEDRQIPYVKTTEDDTAQGVMSDSRRLLKDAIARLRKQGCRNILVLTGRDDITSAPAFPGCRIAIKKVHALVETVVPIGRETAAAWLDAPRAKRPDGVFITDDWIALSFLMRLKDAGIQVPSDLRVVVACNRNITTDLLDSCDRLSIDPDELSAAMTDLMRRRIKNPGQAPACVKIPYRVVL